MLYGKCRFIIDVLFFMNDIWISRMKAVSLLIAALAFVGYVISYSKQTENMAQSSFTVEGKAKVNMVPNVAFFTFTVRTEGDMDITRMQTSVTNTANEIVAALKEKGVEKKDISSMQYTVTPRYENYACSGSGRVCPPAKIVGYTVTQGYEVKVRDMNLASEALSIVTSKGANDVSNLQFSVDEDDAVFNDARKEAMVNARKKAEVLAKAGRFRLGELISVYEAPDQAPYVSDAMGVGGYAAEKVSVPVPTIEPGTQQRTITISVTYKMK